MSFNKKKFLSVCNFLVLKRERVHVVYVYVCVLDLETEEYFRVF